MLRTVGTLVIYLSMVLSAIFHVKRVQDEGQQSKRCSSTLSPNSCPCPHESPDNFCAEPEDCEKFYRCVDGTTKIPFKCKNGTIWSQIHDACVHGFKKFNCTNSPIGFICQNRNQTLHTDPTNCAGYIECWDLVAYHMKCPPHKIWYMKNQTCIKGTC